MSTLRVACVIPTYNGRQDLARLLDSLDIQSAAFDTLIVDSSSSDGSYELALSRCPSVLRIDSRDFNHGGTRQLMVERNPDYDVYVFMTQDAYLEDTEGIARIVAPFTDPQVGAVCGRQLPHLNASPLATHARLFNYPSTSQVKSLADVPTLGIKTAFMSNSFSAYRREALMQVGGFPKHVILSEDMYVGARMLLAGWKVAYEGRACCRHSHNYSLKEEFRRYFDIGVFHAREPWIRQAFGGAGGEGLRYVKSELQFLGPRRLRQWPGSLLRNGVKLVAYKLSQQERYLPLGLKKNLGMYKRYWDSPYA
ncbi:rhamnosyltransferase [Pseudomonas protegens]|uniref:glycosyltransferase family 2 protein n=1 Tax=Pseudomonas protegens TaxID=380021 RepID=UPI000F4CD477|nr:glycosyltransferase family 2 protein [Pseudomonas protegens]ROL66979.1 rhamnosyltransferase [Pseudomonas protegens]